MRETSSFAPLLLVLFLAFVVPLVLTRFKCLKVPVVVGEILAGILIGRSGLGWVQGHDPLLELLAEFGFVFLMFLSGMEIDFSNLGTLSPKTPRSKQNAGSPLSLAMTSFALTLTGSTLVGFGLVSMDLARNPWMMALILSTTSLGVVLPVLKERGLSRGRYGQTLLIAALVADFATMLLITVLVAVVSQGTTLNILLIGLLFVAFFFIYRIGMYFFNRLSGLRKAMQEISHATTQIKVRAAFTMMLIFVVLSDLLGTEVILGAFLAGAIIALLRTPEDAELSPQLETIGFGFFIPIFFIMVGVNFNFAAMLVSPRSMLLVPLLLAAALMVKFLPALVFKSVYSWRETLAAGALLSSRLSLIIAASAIGLELGIIAESVNAAVILVAILTVTMAPPLFIRLLPPPVEPAPRPVIIAGAGSLGLQVAQELYAHLEPVLVVDPDETRVQRAAHLGLPALVGDLTQPDPELAKSMDQVKMLICTYNDPQTNYLICEKARTVFGIDQILAQVSSPNELARFEQLGVTTINAALHLSSLMVLLARNPALYMLMTSTQDNKEVVEVVVENRDFTDLTLRQLTLPGDVLVMALRRNGELLVPHGNTTIELGDHLTLVGSIDSIQEAQELFGQPSRQPIL